MTTSQAPGAGLFTAVLTRPRGQSAKLATRLAAEGFDVFEFPLIEIEPITDTAPLRAAFDQLSAYALVIFVSPNAIDQAFAHITCHWPDAVPIGTVGPGSVAALRRHGIAAPEHRIIAPRAEAGAIEPDYDSESLYAEIEKVFGGSAALAGKRVLIVRGEGGREWLADKLRQAGAEVDGVAAYRRAVPEPSIGAWQRVHELLGGVPHGWLITSSEGVRNLHELAQGDLTVAEIDALRHASFITPHARIKKTACALGFDTIALSGSGDERIVRAFRTLAETVPQPATTPPVTTRMTDIHASAPVTSPGASSPSSPMPSPKIAMEKERKGGNPLLWFIVVALACAAGAGGYALNRKIDRLGQMWEGRQKVVDTQTVDTRREIAQGQASDRQTEMRVAQLEGKFADAANVQQALQQQYQGLALNRDAWIFEDVEQMLMHAAQQLQLTGNPQRALNILEKADTQLAALPSPQAAPVRKALAQDIDRLKSAPSGDLTSFIVKLDEVIGQLDTLPLVGEAHRLPARSQTSTVAAVNTGSEPAVQLSRWRIWAHEFSAAISQELKSLIQVRRIDRSDADALLTSPGQAYFLRENIRLRLLSARIAILSRNAPMLKEDLQVAQAALVQYFDPASKQTQNAEALLKQVEAAPLATAMPDLNASLSALQQLKPRD